MNIKKQLYRLSILILLPVMFTACPWFIQPSSLEISGSFIIQQGKNEFLNPNARTAIPNLEIINSISYRVTATNDSDPAKTVTAKMNGENFKIALDSGTWTLNAEATLSGKIIYKGTLNKVTVNAEEKEIKIDGENALYTNLNITLNPVSNEGNGTVKIKISVGDSKQIDECIASWNVKDSEGNVSIQKQTLTFTAEEETNYFTMKPDESAETTVAPGNYDVQMVFYKNGIVKYFLTENIYVFSNLETNLLLKTEQNQHYVDSSGEFIYVNNENIKKYIQTTKYISSAGKDSEEADGTYEHPYKTARFALNAIKQANELEKQQYTIVLLSDITEDSTIQLTSDNDHSSVLNLDVTNGMNLVITSLFKEGNLSDCYTLDAARTSSNQGRVIFIPADSTLTLRNVKIKGGYLTQSDTDRGAGIINIGKLQIVGHVEVNENKASDSEYSNIFLPEVQPNEISKIEVIGSLSGSKINVAFNNISSYPYTFTKDYSVYNTANPSEYFSVDVNTKSAESMVGFADGEGEVKEAAVILAGGEIKLELEDSVNFEFYLSSLSVSDPSEYIVITVEVDVNNTKLADLPATIKVFDRTNEFGDVDFITIQKDTNPYTIRIKRNKLPPDFKFQVYVEVEYRNKIYSVYRIYKTEE